MAAHRAVRTDFQTLQIESFRASAPFARSETLLQQFTSTLGINHPLALKFDEDEVALPKSGFCKN
jgi:hypothetical protein